MPYHSLSTHLSGLLCLELQQGYAVDYIRGLGLLQFGRAS